MSSIYSGKWEVIILSPHIERVEVDEVMDAGIGQLEHWTPVWFTSHKTGSNTLTSDLAHFLVQIDPKKFREVSDKRGGKCD